MTTDALVVGAGPAGLMAAEEMARTGLSVTVADAMPSFGRKFLMAGKSGLNITKDEPAYAFRAAFGETAPAFEAAIADFGPREAMAWAERLGQSIFTGSSGRVFPETMKASPLLRAWLARLDGLGVRLERRWRWIGWDDAGDWAFETPEGARSMAAKVGVLALGGASWRRLGADGAWAETLTSAGVPFAPFQPANMGFVVGWSEKMATHFGAPVKGVRLMAGAISARGDFVVSARGIEGGGIYAVSKAMRDGAALFVDLSPDLSLEAAAARLAKARAGDSAAQRLRKALKLDPVKRALLMEFARPLPVEPRALAALVKALPLAHDGPRPIDEAISTAGGVAWDGVDENFMLKARPGVFVAGEMLDWEAPTGGYLITACLATGRAAGRGAAACAASARVV